MEALYYGEQLSANDVFKKITHTNVFKKCTPIFHKHTLQYVQKSALGLSSKFHTQMFLENAHSNVSQNSTLKCFSKLHTQLFLENAHSIFSQKKNTHLLCLKKIHKKRG
jgi:hypothetical protein